MKSYIAKLLLSLLLLSSCFPSYLLNRKISKSKFDKIKEVQTIISGNLKKIENNSQKRYISTDQNVKDVFGFLSSIDQDKIISLLENEVDLISVGENKIVFEVRSSANNPFVFYEYQKLCLMYCFDFSNCDCYDNYSSFLLKRIENNWFLVLYNETNKIKG